MRRLLGLWALLWLGVFACDSAGPAPARLDDLELSDSTYHHPATGEPYTGPVERRFPDDSAAVQLVGSMLDGAWEGELRVYHPNGRIRFLGSLHQGRPCGEWIEEQPATDPGDGYERLIDEIESLAVYDPCP